MKKIDQLIIGLQGNASMGTSDSHPSAQTVATSLRPGRTILTIFLCLIIFLCSLPFLLPKLINNDYIKAKAFSLMGQSLSENIHVDHIAMVFFPRPGFRLDGINLYHKKSLGIGIKTAFLFPDIGTLFSRNPMPLTGEILLEQTTLVSSEYNRSPLPRPAIIKNSSIKRLAIHFSYTSLEQFSFNFKGSHLKIPASAHPKHPIYARSLEGEAKITPHILSLVLGPAEFNNPAMNLEIRFLRDNVAHTSQLSFTGEHVHIPPLRAMSSIFLKKSAIATTLFNIVRGGTVPQVNVTFNNKNDQFLFDPKKMRIDARLKGGTIAIPSTQLIATDVMATVQVKNGMLLPEISQGTVEEARLNRGSLQVDLLNKKHPFQGKFSLKADLAKLPGVLKSLLPGTRLSRELELTENIAGKATGTLELTRTDEHLNVAVHCKNIDVTGTYQRFPGNSFHLRADTFSFQKEKITIKGIEGTMGPWQISHVSGEISPRSPHLFHIASARGVFPTQETLAWLTQFHAMPSPVIPFSSLQGTLTLDQVDLKGIMFSPAHWTYAIKGGLNRGSLYDTPEKKGISDISFSFDLSPQGFSLKNITGTLHDTAWVMKNSPQNQLSVSLAQLIQDIHPPITFTRTTLEKNRQAVSFQGQAHLPGEISMAMTGKVSNKNIILEELEIKDPNLSRATVSYSPGSPLTFKGRLNIKTLKHVFKKNSDTAAVLTIPGIKGDCVLAANPQAGVTLSMDRLELDTLWAVTAPQNTKTVTVNKTGQMNTKGNNNALIDHMKMIPRPMLVNVGTLAWNRFLISPLLLEIFPRPTGTDVAIQASKWCGLPITGKIQKKANTINLTLESNARNLDFATIFGCLMEKGTPIQGSYNLKTKLFAMSRENVPPGPGFISGFQGPFELYAHNGRIFQMTFLSRIVSLINVSTLLKAKLPDLSQQGFAYDTMIFKGKVKESRIFIKKGVINGVDMTLLITGWIDPLKKTMDLLCFVSPLKSVDTLIQKLPIINTMFQGDLISIPITAKGSIHDPDVIALSPVEVTKGIFNTLKDILTTPLTLMKELP
ncbi:AsmA-like C-terminal region [Desulfocicer vacuolatum DSM 3385]|uniref:AsmA-like C-terminal region n=1 Tax=Desulfocicer vacuolatum DSM 3385 TaxID=1121400 RepID=A0A1W2D9G8_9BACT|nr:AsmA-like C-terminal domain-containing protein [Desulfocicer vacuolatum]SMC93894.1 AsmA-like C-terminal region [Desulfocicer vacuolatum DSM 3385]